MVSSRSDSVREYGEMRESESLRWEEKLLDTPREVRKSGREGGKSEDEAEEHRSFRQDDVSEMSHFYRNSPVSGAFPDF